MSSKRGTSLTQSIMPQKQLDAKLLAYCAMAGGALLAAPPAEAAVVYSGVKNLAVNSSHTLVSVDFDNDNINDMQFLFSGYALGQIGGYVHIRSQINLMPINNNDVVPYIAAGASIVPALPWSPNGNILNFGNAGGDRVGGMAFCFHDIGGPFVGATVPTYWSLGVEGSRTGYIGVKFTIGNRRHYGWIQYHGKASAQSSVAGGSWKYCYPAVSATGTIIDWAYEDATDYTIQAGQTTGSGNPPVDTDGDGTPDASDNCPTMYNKWQRDTDHDGTGDACDTTPGCGDAGQPYCEYFDTDADGIQNRLDNCPTVSNPRQLDADGDGAGDACDTTPGCGTGCGQTACEAVADTDHDYVIDVQDTCPAVFNPYQLDADSDGAGDCCDADPGCGGGGQPACDTECTKP